MNTQILNYLIAISEEHSLTRAAERFYLSQPSLSHHLANVERELGVKLFRREGRALWPTEEGVIFINNARAILHAEAQARKRIEEIKAEARSHLRLCAPAALLDWLRQQAQPALDAGPSPAQLCLTAAEPDQALAALQSGNQQAALIPHRSPLQPGSWRQERLWQIRTGLALPAALAGGPLPSDLGGLCYLRCPAAGRMDDWGQQCLSEAGIAPRLVCAAPDLDTAAGMVAAGHGCAFLPQAFADAAPGRIAVSDAVPGWICDWSICLCSGLDPDGCRAAELLIQALRRAKLPWEKAGCLSAEETQ